MSCVFDEKAFKKLLEDPSQVEMYFDFLRYTSKESYKPWMGTTGSIANYSKRFRFIEPWRNTNVTCNMNQSNEGDCELNC